MLSETTATWRYDSRRSAVYAALTSLQKASNEKSDPDLINEPVITLDTDFVEDKARSRRLRWKVDLKFLPICGFVYVSSTGLPRRPQRFNEKLTEIVQLLNYLDRGNIGAARIMNKETDDDILTVTGTTTQGYAVAVSVFR